MKNKKSFTFGIILIIVLSTISCKKIKDDYTIYKLQESRKFMTEKKIISELNGEWEANSFFVNGFDSSNYFNKVLNKSLKFRFSEIGTDPSLNFNTLKTTILLDDSVIYSCRCHISKSLNQPSLQVISFNSSPLETPLYNSIGIKNPITKNTINPNGFYIRSLNNNSCTLMENDQIDSINNRITFHYKLKKL